MLNLKTTNIDYRIKTAPANDIFLHLTQCNHTFVPPLAERVNIDEYAEKIFEKSVTFEAWENQLLVGLIAAYFDNVNRIVFITNVSVLGEFVGRGIASNLLNICLEHAKKDNFREINLEVHNQNNGAICFYKKFRFSIHEIKNEILAMKRLI
jgi:ribosomal protein S18 acetylase RimI-like enzyme